MQKFIKMVTELTNMHTYKSGDLVRYKDGDPHHYTVMSVVGEDHVTLSLKEYDDVEEDHLTPVTQIVPADTPPLTKCPLCTYPLEHKQHNDTHAYVCDQCPFVGFEYWNAQDIENLKEIIK